MKKALLYIHGKNGSATEANRFKPLCPGYDIFGLDYKTFTPWETKPEIIAAYNELSANYDTIILIANSIGAYFSMHALGENTKKLQKALFISPIVNMEKLITDMIEWAHVTEQELAEKGEIQTDFGETLSIKYLRYVRENPLQWNIPTEVLYAGNDNLTSRDTIDKFCKTHNANLTIMQNGEHWFHTKEQLAFLDEWVKKSIKNL